MTKQYFKEERYVKLRVSCEKIEGPGGGDPYWDIIFEVRTKDDKWKRIPTKNPYYFSYKNRDFAKENMDELLKEFKTI